MKYNELLNQLAIELNVPCKELTDKLSEYLPKNTENPTILTNLNSKFKHKIIYRVCDFLIYKFMIVNAVSYNGHNVIFKGKTLSFSPDMLIGDKTITFRSDDRWEIPTSNDFNENSFDHLLIDDKRKQIITSQMNYITNISKQFFQN